MLDSIHHTGLRLATGAFRTSPVLSLCCESGIPPLTYRRKQLLLSYGTKIRSQYNNPNSTGLFTEDMQERYRSRLTITRPVGIRIAEELAILNEEYPPMYKLGYCEVPPWKIECPTFHLECAAFKKNETNDNMYRSTFSHILNNYNNAVVIYTDGSKTDNGVGSAFTSQGESYSWCLHPGATIYTAELYAIWQSLRYAEYSTGKTFLICSDSLSAIQALADFFSSDPLIQLIGALLYYLNSSSKKIVFAWVPGHIGIVGNETADQAARHAATTGIPDDIPIRPDDAKAYLRSKVKNIWQTEWNNTNKKLQHIKQTVDRWITPKRLSRREQVTLTRLRIGHTHLTSFHLLEGSERPLCLACNVDLTVKHILVDCTLYTNIRQQLNMSSNLPECLGNDYQQVTKVVEFVKNSGLLRKF